ncbi:MAG: SDR family oxidoreductase [Candidatus Edwardsbacteria bacterium]
MREKILILGGSGFLGSTLIENAPLGLEIHTTYFQRRRLNFVGCQAYEIDLSDKKETLDLFQKVRPDAVIHTAGIGSVDFCEKNQEEGYRNNVLATENVISACKIQRVVSLIYISTNAVFDGGFPPYGEADTTNPINYYGKLKLICEEKIKESGLEAVIIRPIFMYGWNALGGRKNPAVWIIEELQHKRQLHLVNDVYENPLSAYQCAEAIWKIKERKSEKIYHLAGKETVNRYQFGCIVAEVFGLSSELIKEVDSSFFPDIAPRPRNTSFKTQRMEEELHLKPLGLREGLRLMKERIPERFDVVVCGRFSKG